MIDLYLHPTMIEHLRRQFTDACACLEKYFSLKPLPKQGDSDLAVVNELANSTFIPCLIRDEAVTPFTSLHDALQIPWTEMVETEVGPLPRLEVRESWPALELFNELDEEGLHKQEEELGYLLHGEDEVEEAQELLEPHAPFGARLICDDRTSTILMYLGRMESGSLVGVISVGDVRP